MKIKMRLKKEFLDMLQAYKESCIKAGYKTTEEIAEAMFNHINLTSSIPIKKSVIELFLADAYEPFPD